MLSRLADAMRNLGHRPLVVVCVAFIAGVLAAAQLHGPLWAYFAGGAAAVVWLLIDPKRAVAAASLAAMFAGGMLTSGALTVPATDISRLTPASRITVSGVVEGEPISHGGGDRFVLRAENVQVGRIVPVTGLVSVFAGNGGYYGRQDSPGAGALHDGDFAVITGGLERPRAVSNPGAFSWADYLAHRGIWCELHGIGTGSVVSTPANGPRGFAAYALAARERVLLGLKAALPARDDAVLTGVLFGMRGDIAPDTMNAFIATGTVHILATAGLHVGIIVMLLGWARYAVGAPRRWAAVTAIAMLWAYDIMAGGRPAVTRAVVAATIYLAAAVFERVPNLLTSLSAAALLILAISPLTLFEPGFQMSFLTVLTLAALMPLWQMAWRPTVERLHGKPRWAAGKGLDLIGLCLAAQIGAGPIVASEFHIVPLYSAAANLIVVPLVFLLIPSGLLTALVSLAWTGGASALSAVTVTPLISVILAVTASFGGAPGSSVAVGEVPGWMLLLYYAAVCGGGFALQASIARRRRAVRHAPVGAEDSLEVADGHSIQEVVK